MPEPEFYAAFSPDAAMSNSLGHFRLYQRTIAELVVPSGRVVVCDPLVDPTAAPLTVTVPEGRYPVVLAIAQFEDNADERIACAMLRIGSAEPVRWEAAVPAGQDRGSLRPGEVFGYGVDSGTGCFMSLEAGKVLAQRMDADEAFYEVITEQIEENYIHTRGWGSMVIDPATGANLVAFSSGLGDGFYSSYWGYDREENVVCLVTDFAIVGEDEEELGADASARKRWWQFWR